MMDFTPPTSPAHSYADLPDSPRPDIYDSDTENHRTPETTSPLLKRKGARNPKAENTRLKSDVIKMIRRPGKGTITKFCFLTYLDYDGIFIKLKEIQGDTQIKRSVLQEIIQEAKRVKKAQLVTLLEDYSKKV
jgi:hypothetical protein